MTSDIVAIHLPLRATHVAPQQSKSRKNRLPKNAQLDRRSCAKLTAIHADLYEGERDRGHWRSGQRVGG